MASPTQWTWVWVDSGSWCWTGRPGVLQFMGLHVCGSCGVFRTMNRVASAPSCSAFIHRDALEEVSGPVLVTQSLSSGSSQAPEHRLGSCGAEGSLPPWHVESLWTRDQTNIPCIGEVNVGIKMVPFLCFVERATWETFLFDLVSLSRKCMKHGMNPKILECP